MPFALLVTASILGPERVTAQGATDKNLIQVEATFLAGSISYARRIGAYSFGGVGIGLGPVSQRIIYSSGPFWKPGDPHPNNEFDEELDAAEFADLHGFVNYMPTERLQVEFGLRVAPVVWTRASGNSDASFAYFAGGYAAPRFGWKRLKFGPRLQFGLIDAGSQSTRDTSATGTREFVMILTPFLASMQISR